MRLPGRLPLSSPKRLGPLWPLAAVSWWPSAAAVHRGKCCGPGRRGGALEGRARRAGGRACGPAGDPDRNLTHLRESLLEHAPLRPEQLYAMPVEEKDLEAAAKRYALTLREIAGLVRRCLTSSTWASVPTATPPHWCPEIAVLRRYRCRRRADRCLPREAAYDLDLSDPQSRRRVLWLVTGVEKAEMLPRLLAADGSIPAGRVRRNQALVLADRAAAGFRPLKKRNSTHQNPSPANRSGKASRVKLLLQFDTWFRHPDRGGLFAAMLRSSSHPRQEGLEHREKGT